MTVGVDLTGLLHFLGLGSMMQQSGGGPNDWQTAEVDGAASGAWTMLQSASAMAALLSNHQQPAAAMDDGPAVDDSILPARSMLPLSARSSMEIQLTSRVVEQTVVSCVLLCHLV